MVCYAIAFDINTETLEQYASINNRKKSEYQAEITSALAACGFTAHPQGCLYHTEADSDVIASIMELQETLKKKAPDFCEYVKRVHVFRIDELCDVTELITGKECGKDEIVDFE